MGVKHTRIAKLTLSSERVSIGYDGDGDVFYHNQFMPDPHYLSVMDAKLMIAALQLAIAEAEGKN